MKLKPYIDYFKYVMEHKKNVFIECWNEKLYLQAFTHDLSKFLPCEFIPYARYFYIDKDKYKDDFNFAWRHHYIYNKHHWNYYYINDGEDETILEMSEVYIKEMICDWKAMSRKFGGSAQEWYLDNYNNIKLHRDTRFRVECLLGLLNHYNAPICESNEEYWETLQETAIRYKKIELERDVNKWNAKYEFNDLHSWIRNTYKIDDLYDKIIN